MHLRDRSGLRVSTDEIGPLRSINERINDLMTYAHGQINKQINRKNNYSFPLALQKIYCLL